MRDIAEKIVTVATQKIVAILSGEGTELILTEVEELFPYSKVSILFPGKKKEVALFSRDKRSVETLKDLLHENGYNPVIQQREMTEQERSEEHTSELHSRGQLVCRLLLEKEKT